MNTIAIRQRITADANHTIHFTLPPEMGREVEIIIFPGPMNTATMSAESMEMARVMDETGFAKNVLGNAQEDVWNDL